MIEQIIFISPYTLKFYTSVLREGPATEITSYWTQKGSIPLISNPSARPSVKSVYMETTGPASVLRILAATREQELGCADSELFDSAKTLPSVDPFFRFTWRLSNGSNHTKLREYFILCAFVARWTSACEENSGVLNLNMNN